jgi:hypothetical protein
MSKCINCLKEITINEFLGNDYICQRCTDEPEYRDKARCLKCRHYIHVTTCKEMVTTAGDLCECEVYTFGGKSD